MKISIEEIKKGNELIASSLGWRKGTEDEKRWQDQWFDEHKYRYENAINLGFHSNWNQLMRAVQHIKYTHNVQFQWFKDEACGYWCDIIGTKHTWGNKTLVVVDGCDSEIDAVWSAVVEFFKTNPAK